LCCHTTVHCVLKKGWETAEIIKKGSVRILENLFNKLLCIMSTKGPSMTKHLLYFMFEYLLISWEIEGIKNPKYILLWPCKIFRQIARGSIIKT